MISPLPDKHQHCQNDEIVGLEEAVQRRMNSRVRGFRLLALGEGLILLGQTSSYHAKQLAQHYTMEATDLPIVANQIEVLSCQLQPG